MKDVMDFYEIVEIISKGIMAEKSVEIYYSKTEKSREGWRKIKPISITTDIPPSGETLVIGKEHITPGHILNAVESKLSEDNIKSFIMGKIKKAR